LRKPIVRIAGCCARAMIGHVAAAPPSSVMNSRRRMLDLSSRLDLSHLNLPWGGRRVLWADLNCSE